MAKTLYISDFDDTLAITKGAHYCNGSRRHGTKNVTGRICGARKTRRGELRLQ
jgi:hypothetical protein